MQVLRAPGSAGAGCWRSALRSPCVRAQRSAPPLAARPGRAQRGPGGTRAQPGAGALLGGGPRLRRGTERATESPQGDCGHLPFGPRPVLPRPSNLRSLPGLSSPGGLCASGKGSRPAPGATNTMVPECGRGASANGTGGVGS